ncbi:MAG: ectoine hydroxylase [Pseudohongiellaceae bacterium]
MDRVDHYPSRSGDDTGILPRKDPVVYSSLPSISEDYRGLLQGYEANGFMSISDLFSREEAQAMLQELQRLREDRELAASEQVITEPTSREIRSVFRIHELSALFRRITEDPRITSLVRLILNDELYLHQSRANYKPGFRGKEFYWHSDFETWHVEDGMPRMRAVSVAITLTDNYDHNGPLMLVPGSHKRYVQCRGTTPENHYRKSLKRQEYGVPRDENLQRLYEAGGIYAFTGKVGSVVFFDCNTMHGSNGNITPLPRSNLFLVYNALSNRVQSPFSGMPPRPEFIATRKAFEPIGLNKSNIRRFGHP